ncbi:hypothetical protein IWW50_006413, partial [Coemansia erecta]
SRIAAATALLAGSGFAIKKTYDHFNQDEQEQEQEQEQQYGEGHSPNKFKQFFTDEDGSTDKSHVAMAAALFGGLAIGGKKFYDRRHKRSGSGGSSSSSNSD